MRPPVSLSYPPEQKDVCTILKAIRYDVQNYSDPVHKMPSTKIWYIGGRETLRIVKLTSKDSSPVFLDSIFISFHATDKQVKHAPSLSWEPASNSLRVMCPLDVSTAWGLITAPLPTQGFPSCFCYQRLLFLLVFPLAFTPHGLQWDLIG